MPKQLPLPPLDFLFPLSRSFSLKDVDGLLSHSGCQCWVITKDLPDDLPQNGNPLKCFIFAPPFHSAQTRSPCRIVLRVHLFTSRPLGRKHHGAALLCLFHRYSLRTWNTRGMNVKQSNEYFLSFTSGP